MKLDILFRSCSNSDQKRYVENDYLHEPSAIGEMLGTYKQFSKNLGDPHIIISPRDNETWYRPLDVNIRPPSRIVLGSKRHWNTVSGTTSTYLIDRWTLDTYWDLYIKYSTFRPDNDICENNTINLIYRKQYCFSPIPSLTAHVSHPTVITPLFDYMALWEEYRPKSEPETIPN